MYLMQEKVHGVLPLPPMMVARNKIHYLSSSDTELGALRKSLPSMGERKNVGVGLERSRGCERLC